MTGFRPSSEAVHSKLSDSGSPAVDKLEEISYNPESADGAAENSRTTELLRLLWKHKRWVAKVTAWGAVVSLGLAFVIPPRYESTTRLMPPDQHSAAGLTLAAAALGKVSEGIGSMVPELLDTNSSGNLFVGVLKSRTVQDEVIARCELQNAYGGRLTDVRRRLAENTEISTDRKSGIISITVADHKADRAAAVGREYVRELDSVITDLNTSAAHRERVFLEGRLKQVKEELEQSERDFSQFASSNKTPDVTEAGKALIESAASIQGELIATRTELRSLKQVYADNNVRVRSARARIDELQRQLQKIGGSSDAGAANAPADTASEYPSLRNLPLLGVNFADLLRRTKIEEAVFEALTQQYEVAKVEEAKEVPSVKVLDPPDVPDRKAFPPRLLILLLGTGLAAILGAVGVFAWRRWETMDRRTPGRILIEDAFLEMSVWWHGRSGKHAGGIDRLSELENRNHGQGANTSRL